MISDISMCTHCTSFQIVQDKCLGFLLWNLLRLLCTIRTKDYSIPSSMEFTVTRKLTTRIDGTDSLSLSLTHTIRFSFDKRWHSFLPSAIVSISFSLFVQLQLYQYTLMAPLTMCHNHVANKHLKYCKSNINGRKKNKLHSHADKQWHQQK